MNIPDVICGVGIGVGYTLFFGGMVSEDRWEVGIGCALALFGAVCTFWL